MAERISTIKKAKDDGKAGNFTSHKSNGSRDISRNGGIHNSLADAKMLRAWKIVSENRGAVKNSRAR